MTLEELYLGLGRLMDSGVSPHTGVIVYSDIHEDYDEAVTVRLITVGEDTPYCKGSDFDETYEEGVTLVLVGRDEYEE